MGNSWEHAAENMESNFPTEKVHYIYEPRMECDGINDQLMKKLIDSFECRSLDQTFETEDTYSKNLYPST